MGNRAAVIEATAQQLRPLSYCISMALNACSNNVRYHPGSLSLAPTRECTEARPTEDGRKGTRRHLHKIYIPSALCRNRFVR